VKRLLLGSAVLAAAVGVLVVATVPPVRLVLQSPPPDGTIAGILHVHTLRSDGRGTPEEVAAAAARAGLKFLVITDHGDATRPPDPPAYRSGVLCLDGVEISTSGGHYLALGMPAAPYPLGGEPRDVVEDVRRLGGFGIVAHPDSPTPALRWREWTAPFDAIETLNPDTSWRMRVQSPGWRSRFALFSALLDYPFRPPETIASLLEGTAISYRWKILTSRRPVVAIAGVDAHAKLAVLSADPGDVRYSLPFPGYESVFRTVSVHVLPDRPLSGDAAADGATILRAIRAGHLYTAVDAVAGPPSFALDVSNDRGRAGEGDELLAGGPVSLHVRSNAPPGFETIVWNGTEVVTSRDSEREFTIQGPAGPAVYFVEIRGRNVPWIASNAVYVRAAGPPLPAPERRIATESRTIFDRTRGLGWTVEHDASSTARLEIVPLAGGSDVRLRYALGAGSPAGQFAALAVDVPSGLGASDRLAFTIAADKPTRVSVQLRADGKTGRPAERWRRSVHVDTSEGERTVYFDDLVPAGEVESWRPRAGEVRTILFVIDTTNTRPGSAGQLVIRSAALQW
jgi:hypothetical protein